MSTREVSRCWCCAEPTIIKCSEHGVFCCMAEDCKRWHEWLLRKGSGAPGPCEFGEIQPAVRIVFTPLMVNTALWIGALAVLAVVIGMVWARM